ncbi:MAG: DUF4231 domain-containing protein [Granulosicoccus sp.]|nr:DUF4231 domain-containing protein [Granulosicoccus sp.]
MDSSRVDQALNYLSPADYIRTRVDDQLTWYGDKSAFNKRWYYRLQLVTLLAATAIPVISLSSANPSTRILVALIGAIAAVSTGVLSLFQFRDQWMDYRSTAEALKFEKHLYLTRAAPYQSEDAYSLFVNRIEATIISENRGWLDKSFGGSADGLASVSGASDEDKLGQQQDRVV